MNCVRLEPGEECGIGIADFLSPLFYVRLCHPHIAALYELNTRGTGMAYLNMEFLPGGDLHRRSLVKSLIPSGFKWFRK